MAALLVGPSPAGSNPDGLSSPGLPPVLEALKDTHRIVLANKLQINLDPSTLLIVPDKCEKTGEFELKLLAKSAEFEEAYLFIPSLCTWVEVGLDEGKLKIHIDSAVLEKLSFGFPLVILYHTHTGAASESAGYFPAFKDLIATILFGSEFSSFHNRIIHRAVSPLGVFEYEFVPTQETYRLKELIDRSGLGQYALQNLTLIYATSVHRERYYKAVRGCRLMIMQDPYHLDECFPIILENFVIRYQSRGGTP